MARISLNPTKGISLKQAQGWIRKTVKGRRIRVKVDFTKEVVTSEQGNLTIRMDGRSYKASMYDIRFLAMSSNPKGAFNRFAQDVWRQSNQAGMNYSKAEALDLITERLNLYNKYSGWKLPVAYIYSKNSKVIRGTENLMAVRLRNGQKGWLDADGRFISQDSMYQLMLGLDGTVASGQYGFSFGELWANMSAQQRADFTDLTKDVNWDAFWMVSYDRNNPLDDAWLEALDEVVQALLSVVE